MTMFASLVDAVRRNAVYANGEQRRWSREQFEMLSALQPYDLGGLFLKPGSHPQCVDDDTWATYIDEVRSDLEGPGFDIGVTSGWAIEFLWEAKGDLLTLVIPTPGIAMVDSFRHGGSIYCFALRSGEWHLEEFAAQQTVAVAIKMVRDAEMNVEYVERQDDETDGVNRRQALRKRPAIKNLGSSV